MVANNGGDRNSGRADDAASVDAALQHDVARADAGSRTAGGDEEPDDAAPQREPQDRSAGRNASSPVDSQHVDAPTRQDNARGHRQP